MCYREGVGYLEVVHRVYTGESHSSLPFRLERHIDDYRPILRKRRKGGGMGMGGGGGGGGRGGGGGGKGSSSWMWDHVAEAHGGLGSEEPHHDFTFYLTNTFTKAGGQDEEAGQGGEGGQGHHHGEGHGQDHQD